MALSHRLGIRDESGEILIGTDRGVVKCRTVRRKATDEERWDRAAVELMKGTTWEPTPGRDSTSVQIALRRWNAAEAAQGPSSSLLLDSSAIFLFAAESLFFIFPPPLEISPGSIAVAFYHMDTGALRAKEFYLQRAACCCTSTGWKPTSTFNERSRRMPIDLRYLSK